MDITRETCTGIVEAQWWPVHFTLVANDFEVQYVGKEHVKYLRNVIKKYYSVTEDWSGLR